MLTDRFECLQQSPGNWTVWDHTTAAPARLGGVELRGQDKHKAEIARDILIRIFRKGQPAGGSKRGGSDA